MKLDIFFLFIVGSCLQISAGEEKSNSVNATTQEDVAPARTQKHEFEKKSPEKSESNRFSETKVDDRPREKSKKKDKEKEEVIVHDHGDRHYYESQPKKYKSTPYDFDKEYNDDSFEKYLRDFKINLGQPHDDGFKTSQTIHTEHFEVKELNPKATTPQERYIIRGGYKVQETDPFDPKTKKTHLHTYDSPLSKIAASIYSKFDYHNFPQNDKNESEENDGDEKEEEAEDAESSNDFYASFDKDDEKDDEKEREESEAFFADLRKSSSAYSDDKKKKDKEEDDPYAAYSSNEQSDEKDETKTTEYYSAPDLDDPYSNDWKKYILELVYGDFEDYYSPSVYD